MPIVQQKPVTPSGRFYFKNKVELSDKRPEKALTKGHHRKKGRNTYGRITQDVVVVVIKDFTVKLIFVARDLMRLQLLFALNMILIERLILLFLNTLMV